MAYKRRYRKKTKTRARRKTRKNFSRVDRMDNTVMSVRRAPLGRSIKRTVRYLENEFFLNGGTGGLADEYLFSCNGLYDPNISGVGHQPIGFDQLMLMYDHFVVIASKITVHFRNTDANVPYLAGIRISDRNSEETDVRKTIENGNCIWTHLDAQEGSGKDVKTLSYTINPNKFLARTKPLSDPELKGSVSANPTEQCYFNVFCGSVGSVDGGNVQCTALVEYTTVFLEPKLLNLS